MHHQSSHPKPELAAIFVQYDRAKYPLALERFVDFLTRLGVGFQVIVVDNANPGPWCHEVSSQLVQIGGDNSAWEFSAFDRGVDFAAASQPPAAVYAFATDAFLAYGDEYLELIDAATLESCVELEACAGWIDSFGADFELLGYDYREWMRTSLFFMPREILRQLSPLRTPFDPGSIFSPDPGKPFLDSAPLSRSLQSCLLAWLTTAETDVALAEPWHSRFDLTDETIGFFQQKVSAILREMLLSARLQARGVPCYHFELLEQLRQSGLSPRTLSGTERKAWGWSGWKNAEIFKPPRYNLEQWTAPQTLVHGDPAELRLVGWVVAEPQPREVEIRLSNGEILGGRCDLLRPDVLERHPEFTDELCGFEIAAKLDHLPPGSYAAEWSARGLQATEDLGRIRVLPRCDFEVSRRFLPESAYPRQPFAIAVEGELTTSHRLEEIQLLWDGEELDFSPDFFNQRRKVNGLYVYEVTLQGPVTLSGHRTQHRLELVFQTENGHRFPWKHYAVITPSETLPHSLPIRVIGERDPRTGLVPVRLSGAVLAAGSDARLVLMREQHAVLEERLSRPYRHRSVACFDLERRVSSLPPGSWTFRLAVKHGDDAAPEVFAQWRDQVRRKEPRVEVDGVEVRPVKGHQSRYLLRIAGWIHNHFLVDRVLLKVDGSEKAEVLLNQLAQELPFRDQSTLVKRQGFHRELFVDAEPGEHTLQLLAVQDKGGTGSWERQVHFPKPTVSSFWLQSADLEAIDEGRSLTFWSSIVLRGEVAMKHRHVVGTLSLDGEVADQKVITTEGEFRLGHTPRRSGYCDLEVTFEDEDGLILYRSTPARVLFRRVDIPEEMPTVLNRFIRRFELERLLGPPDITELSRLLIEREREGLPELVRMLRSIGSALEREVEHRAAPRYSVAEPKRLKVLYACWEVPCSRHGGGVLMVNLLKRLSEKHEITVVHPYSADEKGLSAEIRDHVAGVIAVPRDYYQARFRGDSRLPRSLYDNYTPELQAAIQAEIFSQHYDIVNYEYSEMYPYISGADIPQVIDVLEDPFSAALYACRQESSLSRFERVVWVGSLLRNFYFYLQALPAAIRHVITVTEEDAELLRAFQGKAQAHVNTIGVAAPELESIEIPEAARAEHPTFVFLGNYRHPPNVAAARFFAEEVMPKIRGSQPRAELLVIGPHPPEDVRQLDELPYVRVTGFVPDFRPYLLEASAFVAPIKTGAGMRVKILEAMACGVPVIGTALAMQGIGGQDGVHYFGAESAEEFAAASARCIAEADQAARVGHQGRELVVEKHGYQASAAVRERIWQHVVDDRRARQIPTGSSSSPRLSVIRGAEGSGET